MYSVTIVRWVSVSSMLLHLLKPAISQDVIWNTAKRMVSANVAPVEPSAAHVSEFIRFQLH